MQGKGKGVVMIPPTPASTNRPSTSKQLCGRSGIVGQAGTIVLISR
jgi:hypothetical protein